MFPGMKKINKVRGHGYYTLKYMTKKHPKICTDINEFG